MNEFNSQHRVDSLYAKGWNLSLAKSVYEANCDGDINAYESTPLGTEQKGFLIPCLNLLARIMVKSPLPHTVIILWWKWQKKHW